MKILVALAFHGTKNRPYLDRVIEEYRSMPHQTHVVVLTEAPKDLPPDVEMMVAAPTDDPWSLPFAHKALFAERINDYDLFIYSEDDILISRRNIEAFLEVQSELLENEIPGFLRTERTSDGRVSFPEAHWCFHWRCDSWRRRGALDLAVFSNHHAGCYVLTRRHLGKAIASGGFLVPVHEGRYDLLVTAATDPYTQCGMTKLICLSRLDDFLVSHLSNRYAGVYGLEGQAMRREVVELLALPGSGKPMGELIPAESRLPRLLHSKNYYEPVRTDMLSLMPPESRKILSIGCGTGETEGHLVEKGCSVSAIPLDPVVGAVAAARGVRILSPDLHEARKELGGQRFDCVLCAGVLHLAENPVAVAAAARDLLDEDGVLIVSVPNLNHHASLVARLKGLKGHRDVGNYQAVGIHKATRRHLRAWLKQAGLKVDQIIAQVPPRKQWLSRVAGTLGTELAAEDLIASARKPRTAKDLRRYQPGVKPVASVRS